VKCIFRPMPGSASTSMRTASYRHVGCLRAGPEIRPRATGLEPVAHADNHVDVGVTILLEVLAQLADVHITVRVRTSRQLMRSLRLSSLLACSFCFLLLLFGCSIIKAKKNERFCQAEELIYRTLFSTGGPHPEFSALDRHSTKKNLSRTQKMDAAFSPYQVGAEMLDAQPG
jgi:hypothetical protein